MINKQDLQNWIEQYLKDTEYELITLNISAGNDILVEVDRLAGVDVDFCAELNRFLVDKIEGLVDEGISGLGISGLVAKTFVYYLLVTITPNVPIAEVGVRGAWAIVVFGTMNAALAGVLLWIINTLLPCLFALGISAKRQTSR